MNDFALITRTDLTVACPPASIVPHAVAHATLGERFWQRTEAVGGSFRTRGDVYVRPAGPATVIAMGSAPITDDKFTVASVPGRRGGT
ncbi:MULTISPECIES: hypothetical protein [Pseudonocardia]|uniref:Uncharacterized protein n=2 Tax=Pseudonocardia TaxID=1847 RepID=A0A1Y2N4X0_PSEAH|nr:MULTISPECIES: hypothetical protein [Pseudonocardia]OSY42523.1 hypothetical protein BG845_01443 [Pseudonocardia autotrophica]TDN76042.1 hypothetical protein C8E95_5228 [Pseudonocardia autotrophica]BBG00019.1 hypothetical protein Pdca_12280 [Pseudonocardia autotrophica]GEC28061.1 hypothetical protein PSA01_50900 [Pseudonocardia saturnea]